MKKLYCVLMSLLLLASMLILPTPAVEDEPEFRFELTVDGSDTIEVLPGDIITVTLYLYRTDTNTNYTMHAMQDEIRYDSTMFELIEDSPELYTGVHSTQVTVSDSIKEFYMNFLSFSGGASWKAKTRVGSFRLQVKGTSGVTAITNEDISVSLPNGSGSYKCEANELIVVLSTDCTVKFQTNGGTPIEPATIFFGEKVTRPADPVREGKVFAGWYQDLFLKQAWDFENDVVERNMTLYAKWIDPEPPTTDEPSTDEPSTDEPSTDEPSTDEPSTDEPSTDEPSTDEPSTDEPSTDEPSTDEPSTDEPSTDEPSTDEPSTDEPSTDEPSTDEPSTDEPSTDEPSTDEPSTDEPSTDEPSTDEPSTDEPSTDEPSTDEPSTEKPSTEKPSTDDESCVFCGRQHFTRNPSIPMCLISWMIVLILSIVIGIWILWYAKKHEIIS